MASSYLSSYLPKEFIPRHELLLYYNDIIVDILRKADEFNLSQTTFSVKEDIKLPEKDEDLIDWMLDNGFENEAYSSLKAHLFFSLLRDFIFYMHESFDCSERGKVTVAYTICRKPIKDTLFYLCWLLVDGQELMNNLMKQNPREYDVSSISASRKKDILECSNKLVGNEFEKDILYNLIYKRDCEYGLSSIWDQSIHLVTGNKNYPTEAGNLNFIFAYDEIWQEFWNIYYQKIPLIMNFAIEVIIKIFESILKPETSIITFNKYVREIKLLKMSQIISDDFINTFKSVLEHIKVTCEECSNSFNFKGTVSEEFINDYLYTCPHCGNEERVGIYIFDKSS
ncbi:hypothetical protein KDN24_08525 [Bacillus sp. Bva_UNVM-123]|uniref:hypothetical protein n=1 Tax=Bacillus sp. Bva_UNVM-123 TaxID=2829798 RepID=UPI00391F2A33